MDDLCVHPLHLLFFHQNTLEVSHHPGGDAIEHVIIFLLPPDWLVICWVLYNSQLVFFDHADQIMKFLCLCYVKYIQALLTDELIVNVGVLLV